MFLVPMVSMTAEATSPSLVYLRMDRPSTSLNPDHITKKSETESQSSPDCSNKMA